MRALRQGQDRHPLQQRRDDFYETPGEATRALLHVTELPRRLWDPCAGRGAISRELELAGHTVIAQDLCAHEDADPGSETPIDFLMERQPAAATIIMNPPYKLADAFIEHGLDLGCQVVALLRLASLEGTKRSRLIDRHLRHVFVGIERLPMLHRHDWAGPRITHSAVPFAWFDFRPDPRPAGQLIALERISWRRAGKMIPESVRTRLKKLALLLSSPEANEALAARNAIDRLLRTNGLDWHDFGALFDAPAPPAPQPQQSPPQPQQPYGGDRPWQEVAEACLAQATRYSAKEQKFLEGMRDWHAQPSRKQLDWLVSLRKKISRQWADVP